MKHLTVGISLRDRLVLLILFIFLPAFLIILMDGYKVRENSRDASEKEALKAIRIASMGQEHLVEVTHQLLLVLAHLPQVKASNVSECQRLFSELLNQYPIYRNLTEIFPQKKLNQSSCSISTDGDIYAKQRSLVHPVNFITIGDLVTRNSGCKAAADSYNKILILSTVGLF